MPTAFPFTMRTLILVTAVVALSGSLSIAADKIQCTPINSEIVIDGKIDDWNDLEVRYHNDDGTVLGLCNDQDYLYIQLRFREPTQAAMIRRHNVTIWIDNNGKKNKYYRVRYNNGLSPDQMASQMRQPGEQEHPEAKMSRMAGAGKLDEVELQCYREGWRSPRSFALDGSDPVAAAFDTSFSFFVYEFRVPLGDSLSSPDGFELGKKGRIGIGLEFSELKMSMQGERRDMSFDGQKGGGGGRGGGRGGMGGGMLGGGKTGGGMRGKGKMEPERKEKWFKTEIVFSEKE